MFVITHFILFTIFHVIDDKVSEENKSSSELLLTGTIATGVGLNDDELLEQDLLNTVHDDSEGLTLEKFQDELYSDDDLSQF